MEKRSKSIQKDIENNNKVLVKISGNPLFLFLAVALFLSLVVGIIISKLYLDTQKQVNTLQSQISSTAPTPDEKETKKILEKVEKHLILPSGSPQVITVNNVETLKKNQPFFNNLQNGHQLLIYQNKVIIYDPLADKIVDIAYIKPTEAPSPTAIPVSATVAKSPSPTVPAKQKSVTGP